MVFQKCGSTNHLSFPGFKGKQYGDAGVHKNQALVLVNYGNATGGEIWNLALRIQKEVKEIFGIHIEPEVNII